MIYDVALIRNDTETAIYIYDLISNEILQWDKAVSYTHLDVYKRQSVTYKDSANVEQTMSVPAHYKTFANALAEGKPCLLYTSRMRKFTSLLLLGFALGSFAQTPGGVSGSELWFKTAPLNSCLLYTSRCV